MADMFTMTLRRAWLGFSALGLALIAGYFAVGRPSVQDWLYEVIGGLSVAAVAVGVARNRPRRSDPWYLIAVGAGLLVTGDVLWTYYPWGPSGVPFPSLADAVYLSAYPFLAAGLLRLRRPATRTLDRARLVETLIITTGIALLGWESFFEPYALDPSLSLLERMVSLAYPLADVLMIAVLVRLAVGMWSRTPAYGFLVVSILSALVADVVYAAMATQGTYYTGSPVDAGWLVFYLLLGVAALHPSMRRLSDPAPEPPARLTRARLLVLAVATLVAPSVVWIEAVRDDTRSMFILLITAALLFLLVVARMALLVREVEAKADALRRSETERKRLLDRILRASEDERVHIAAALHDGPIQRLAMLGYTLERGRLRLERGDLAAAGQGLVTAQESLSREVHGLRQMMSSLRPPALDEQGLEGALRDQAAAFAERSRIRARFQAQLHGRFAPEVETILYRVAQEALTNVAKHARASQVWVDVRQDSGSVELAVRDDGVGFDPESAAVIGDHFGLAAMREQVQMAGGNWTVRSRLGQGTEIHAVLPVGGRR
jgi:signal transduction histidine kinase